MKAFQIGDTVDEKYEIVGVLGQGGMGAVFQAKHLELDSMRALKIPDPSILEDEVGRKLFVREAQASERLSHPNIIRIYDVVNKPDLIYIAMELIDGIPIHKYINENMDRLTLRHVLNLIEQICQALDWAHEQGVIHRDIKPSNILVDRNDDRLKILDFGIARVSGKTMTDFTLRSAGTPRYMAPEQFKGLESMAQTDLYSMGVIVYQIFTGHVVFEADTSDALGFMHVHEPPPNISKHNANLPNCLNEALQRLLAKDPKDRYQTGMNFYQAVRSCLDPWTDEPLTQFLEEGPSKTVLDTGGATTTTEVDQGPTGPGGTVMVAEDTTEDLYEGDTTDKHRPLSQQTTRLETSDDKKKKVAMLAGVGVVLLIVIGAIAMMMSGGDRSTQVADQTDQSTVASQPDSSATTADMTTEDRTESRQTQMADAGDQTRSSRIAELQNARNPQSTSETGNEPGQMESAPGQSEQTSEMVTGETTEPRMPEQPSEADFQMAELNRVKQMLNDLEEDVVPADKQRIADIVEALEAGKQHSEYENAVQDLPNIHARIFEIKSKQEKVKELAETKESLFEQSRKLHSSGWLQEGESAPHENWQSENLQALKQQPWDENHSQLYNKAESDLQSLEKDIRQLASTIDKRQDQSIQQEMQKVETLDNDLQKVLTLSQTLKSVNELEEPRMEAIQLESELNDLRTRFMQYAENPATALEYTQQEHSSNSQTVDELTNRFRRIREAIYKKPIVSIKVDDEKDEIAYGFVDERNLLNNTFQKNGFVISEQAIQHDATYIVSVELRAQKTNERTLFGGELTKADYVYYYDIKLNNGGAVLHSKSNKVVLSGTPSQINSPENQQKLQSFKESYAADVQAVEQQINESFKEVAKE